MLLKTIKSGLVNLEILCYIAEQKKCSTNQLLKLFKDKIARRTLYHALKEWDLEEKVIVRDGFEGKKARYSHFTIKPTPKLAEFLHDQLYAFLSSIFQRNLKPEVNDSNLRFQKDLEDIHKNVSIPQILELSKETGLSDLSSEIFEILTKSVKDLILRNRNRTEAHNFQ